MKIRRKLSLLVPLTLTSLVLGLNACQTKVGGVTENPYVGVSYVKDKEAALYDAQEVKFINLAGYAIVGGDQILGTTVEAEATSMMASMVVGDPDKLWPGGYIPYRIAAELKDSTAIMTPLEQAIENWNSITYIDNAGVERQIVKFYDLDDPNDPNRRENPLLESSPKKELYVTGDDIPSVFIQPWDALKVSLENPDAELMESTARLLVEEFVNEKIDFYSKSVCLSRVGRIKKDQEFLVDTTIGNACDVRDLTHELGHTVGLFHTHNRWDRDDYITILDENIMQTDEDKLLPSFTKSLRIFFVKGSALGVDFGPYDFRSIMHPALYKYGEKVNLFDPYQYDASKYNTTDFGYAMPAIPDDPATPFINENTVLFFDRKQTISPRPEKLIEAGVLEGEISRYLKPSEGDIQRLKYLYVNHWVNDSSPGAPSVHIPPVALTSETAPDAGRRFIDMDSDGDLDLVYNRIRADGSRDKGAWLNESTGWERAPVAMDPPLATHKGALGADYGGRYVDVDGDDDLDMLYGYKDALGRVTKHAFLYVDKDNDGKNDSWIAATEYNPPVLATYYAGDVGRVFVDIGSIDSTGAFTNVPDGRLDIITHRLNTAANTTDLAAWVNSASNVGGAAGSIWQRAPIGFNPPRETAHDGVGHTGYTMVDVDHDGLKDFLFNRMYVGGKTVKVAYLNRDAGWHCDAPINSSDVSPHDPSCSHAFFEKYGPPANIAAVGLGDRGSRYIDLNGDGKLDLVTHLKNGQKGAWINSGNGWESAPAFVLHNQHIAEVGVADSGVRFVDINGDNLVDMVYNREALISTNHSVGAYINKGADAYLTGKGGWEMSGPDAPQFPLSKVIVGDVGKTFVDVNNDGFKDIIYHHIAVSGVQTGVFLNGNGALPLK